MEWLFFLALWGLIGTVAGRILFRMRLGINSRYQVGKQLNEYNRQIGPLRAIDTDDLTSAQTYGLWSIPLWPLTIAMFVIQAPTPVEKQRKKEIQLQEAIKNAESMLKELSN